MLSNTMAEATARGSAKARDSRGDAEDGYNSSRESNGEDEKLVRQDGVEGVLYTDELFVEQGSTAEEYLETPEWTAPDGG